MKQNVEAEGGELILRNAEGHIAIIPKHLRGKAEAYLEAEDQHSLGGLINSLPRAEDYAEDGSLYIGTPPEGEDPEKEKYGINFLDEAELAAHNQRNRIIHSIDPKNTILQKSQYVHQFFDNPDYNKEINTGVKYSGQNRVIGSVVPGSIHNKSTFYENESDRYDYSKMKDKFELTEQDFIKYYKDFGPVMDANRYKHLTDYYGIKVDKTPIGEKIQEGEGLRQFKKYVENPVDSKKAYGGMIKAKEGLTVPPVDPPTSNKKQLTYDNVKGFKPTLGLAPSDYGFGDLQTLQGMVDDWETNPSEFKPVKELENETYFRYVAKDNAPTISSMGCTGSSCRAQKQFNPDLVTPYDVLSRQGIIGANTKGEVDSPGTDAWEIANQLESTGKGKKLFSSDPYNTEGREEYLNSFDYSKLPLNTLLSFGEARGAYVAEDANIVPGKKNMPLPRHTATLIKYDEETGDAYVYNPGYQYVKGRENKGHSSIIRIGSSKDADYNWKEFAEETGLVYATSINDAGDWTHKKLKEYKQEKTETSKIAKEPLLLPKKITELKNTSKKKLLF